MICLLSARLNGISRLIWEVGLILFEVGVIVEYNINILLWLVVNCSNCRIFLPIFIHVTCVMDVVIWGNVESTPYSANHDYKCFMKAKLQVIMEEDLCKVF